MRRVFRFCPEGGGTSQCGQTIGEAVVLDTSRYLTGIGDPNSEREVEVQPGVVLDHLNARLAAAGLWFPVDPSTGSRATLGGMAGNNSAGARSLKYGMMVDNVSAAELVLPDGRRIWVGEGADESSTMPAELLTLRALFEREADEIARTTPRTMRKRGGLQPRPAGPRPREPRSAPYRVRRHPRLLFPAEAPAQSPLRRGGSSGFVTSTIYMRRWTPCNTSWLWSRVRWSWWIALCFSWPPNGPASEPRCSASYAGAPRLCCSSSFSTDTDTGSLSRRLDALEALLGDLGHPDSVIRASEPGPSSRRLGRPQSGVEYRDVHGRPSKAHLFHRGLCGTLGASRTLCASHRRDFQETRYDRHLVRPCVRRVSACASRR